MNVLKPSSESSLVVFGLGTVGLTALMGAKYLKARQIIAVDIQASKFPLAKELGATDVINGRETSDVVAKIKEITGGIGADFAVDATGVPKVIEGKQDDRKTQLPKTFLTRNVPQMLSIALECKLNGQRVLRNMIKHQT